METAASKSRMKRRVTMFGMEIPADVQADFYKTVWKIVREIPRGKVSTYGQIAALIPPPALVAPADYQANRARWVGNAMAASPQDVPWQRVINSQGKISVRKGAETQRKQLEEEGVIFDSRDKVDLKRFGWEGPSVEWLRENGLTAPDEPEQLSLL